MKPTLKAPGTKSVQLNLDVALYNFAVKSTCAAATRMSSSCGG